MELYPIKKLIKEYEDLHPEKKRRQPTNLMLKSSHSLSPKDQILKQYYHQKGQMKRFDREFTVSWAQKQEINANPANPSNTFASMTKSAFFGSAISSPCARANTLQNRNVVVHLSTEQDQERLGTKIYQPEVYELRQQNEDNIAQTLNIKNQYKQSFNTMAKQYNLKSYRSELSTSVGHRSSHSVTCSPTFRCLTPQLNTEPSGVSETTSTTEESALPNLTLTKSHFFSLETPKENPAALLGELEGIYLKDLKSETSKMPKAQKLADSPYKNGQLRRQMRRTLGESECKNLLDDKVLLEKFEDPYGNHLPFERPIHANIKNQKSVKLQELETKAQILKNLKSIHTDMAQNVLFTPSRSPSMNQSGRLPRIKHSFDGGKRQELAL